MADDPRRLTLEWKKVDRGDKIYVDVNRNAYAQHAVAPYGVRPRDRAPVAVPVRWEELSDRNLRPDRWTIRNVADRLEEAGDPWQGHGPARAQAAGPRLTAAGSRRAGRRPPQRPVDPRHSSGPGGGSARYCG